MRRSICLAALLLAALFAGGDAQPAVGCPYTPPSWNLALGNPSSVPTPSFCNTTNIYPVFYYWTPELAGSTLSFGGAGTNPIPSAFLVTPIAYDAAGNSLASTVTCSYFADQLGPYPGSPPTRSQQRTCGANVTNGAGNAASLPAAPVIDGAILPSAADCCIRCTNTLNCRQWAFSPVNATGTSGNCTLYNAIGTFTPGNITTSIAIVGNSAGWGSGFVDCTGSGLINVARVTLTVAGSYTQRCNGTSTAQVAPTTAPIDVAVAPAVDGPVATMSNLTVTSVCAGAAAVTGSFYYTGSNIVGQTAFAVTLNGAPCTPGAGNITGISAGQFVPYSCNVAAPGVPAGPLNVTATASYSGSQVGRCAGVRTVQTSGFNTATTAPTAAFGAAPNATTLCTGNTQIITTFQYTSTAATTSFTASSNPTAVCSATPTPPTGSSQTVTVVCNRAAGFTTGSAVITLSATYTGTAPCTASTTISQNATVTVTPAESGVSFVPASTPASVCAPASSVQAAYRFNATNVGTITFTATSPTPGVSCTPNQPTLAGSTGTVSYVVLYTCSRTDGQPLQAGIVSITPTATWLGQGQCAGGSVPGIPVSVVVEPTPSVTVAPLGPAAPDCFGATTVTEDFRVTVTNGAGPTTLTARLAGLFNCTVTPASLPGTGVVSVTCSKPDGFPSGNHNLTLTAVAAVTTGPCAGTYTATGYSTITVLPPPSLTITPVTVDRPLCAGDPSVTVEWTYSVSGTVGAPVVTAISAVSSYNGTTCVLNQPANGRVSAVCTGLPTTDASVDITLTMSVTEAGCGTVTQTSTNTYTVACCLKGATAYAKNDDNNANPSFCYKHQRPNNVQTRNCPFYYGWFNQGPTTSNVPEVTSVSKLFAMADPTAADCPTTTTVADVTAVCEGVLDPPLGPIPGQPFPSRGDHVLKVTVTGYKYSTAKVYVYAGCPRLRTGAIPLSSTTCANTATTWKPWNWNHYAPRTINTVAPGRAPAYEFRIPISRTGSCTCANLYWTVVAVGDFVGVPCPTAAP